MKKRFGYGKQHFLVHFPHQFIRLFFAKSQFHHRLIPCHIRRGICIIKGKNAVSDIRKFLRYLLKQDIGTFLKLPVKILTVLLTDISLTSCHGQMINKIFHALPPASFSVYFRMKYLNLSTYVFLPKLFNFFLSTVTFMAIFTSKMSSEHHATHALFSELI